jgi:hypothetical protein
VRAPADLRTAGLIPLSEDRASALNRSERLNNNTPRVLSTSFRSAR